MTVQYKQESPLQPESPVLLDVDRAMKRLGGKEWIYIRILQQFVIDCRHFAETIGRCLARQDRRGAERLAHKMKGGAGQIGAEALYVMAPALRQMVATQPTEVAIGELAEFEGLIKQTVAVIKAFLVSKGIRTDLESQPLGEPERIPQAGLLESIRQHASMGRFSRIERIIDDLERKNRNYETFCAGMRKHIRTYDEAAIAAYIDRWT
ncbi:hypothetical protein DSCO28_39040 [Desulfosarcina ovata subsp. sediminis]|uniref:HPt domain-containing protein n=1 Tax=Desulfosarcina ovata subsp. sediminis TaxID=885957 RepID=A0A5K7ZT18_9BACT|nr:Hpt domain-containing protein [Desulfosarcina ovata]BBO83338.1 hypothetical protein DSCO28_39040 [Desulfosarcina ovata subsp. sediminis]